MLEICLFGAFVLVGRAGLAGEPLLTSRSPYAPVARGEQSGRRELFIKRVKVLRVGLGHERRLRCMRIAM